MKVNHSCPRQKKRQGTIYLLVLFSSLIVATISLSSLQLMRLQARTASDSADFSEARSYARAALEVGMLRIRNDPFWRTNFGNGNWLVNQTIGTGRYTLSVVDPIDNDIRLGDNHPVVLTGTGMKGAAVFKTSVRMEVGPRAGSCLEVSMMSGNNSIIGSSTLVSDQRVSANGNYNAISGASVNADVEAFGSIAGSTYPKATMQLPKMRDMPNSVTVFDYYTANGTAIPYTALPLWNPAQLITNPGFESGTSNWYPLSNCVLQRSAAQALQGSYSLLVRSRSMKQHVAAQDVPVGLLKSGNKYLISMPVFPTSNGTVRAVMTLTSSGSGTQVYTTPSFDLKKTSGSYTWVDVSSTITPTWSGTLTTATISLDIDGSSDYYIDRVSLTDATYSANSYVIDRKLLSPTVNPFGSLNSNGIYVINCSGKDVVIGRSRIVGTIVLLSPGSNSAIQDSVCWEAAVYNFPALLSNNSISINMSATGLSEASLGMNFNPAGTPFPFNGGSANTTVTDSYPSRITGLVYSANDLFFSNAPNIQGVTIANQNINVSSTSLTLNYGNTYLNDPPPGFAMGSFNMKVVPGTWTRTAN